MLREHPTDSSEALGNGTASNLDIRIILSASGEHPTLRHSSLCECAGDMCVCIRYDII